MPSTVSFDFDGVLHKSTVKGSIHPVFWEEWSIMQPFEKIHDLVRQYADKGHRVICTTARNEMPEVWRFIRHYDLPITKVFFTGGYHKAELLQKEGVAVHYDDHPLLKDDMEGLNTTIKTVYPHEDRWDD